MYKTVNLYSTNDLYLFLSLKTCNCTFIFFDTIEEGSGWNVQGTLCTGSETFVTRRTLSNKYKEIYTEKTSEL